jgi:hypothetical protein
MRQQPSPQWCITPSAGQAVNTPPKRRLKRPVRITNAAIAVTTIRIAVNLVTRRIIHRQTESTMRIRALCVDSWP